MRENCRTETVLKPDICHVSTTFNLKSGSARRTIAVAERAKADGYSVLLVVGADNDLSRYTGPVEFVVVKSLKKPVNLFRDVISFAVLLMLFRKIKPRIVHTHLAKAGFIGRVAARISLKNTIILHTVHGPTFDKSQPKIKFRFYLLCERLASRYTHTIVFVGNYVQCG